VVTIKNLTNEFAIYLYDNLQIKTYLEEQLLTKLTRHGLVTLRFDYIDLTGTDGCPMVFNDWSWRKEIRQIVRGVEDIYEEITATANGCKLAKISPKAEFDKSTQHMMVHLHQDTIYGETDGQVDAQTEAFLAIVKEEGCYEEAFDEPIWHGTQSSGLVAIRTTNTGDGCLFSL
jgi:hypothetical protein